MPKKVMTEREAYFSGHDTTFQFFSRKILFFFLNNKSLCTNNAEDHIRSSDYIRCSLLSITITSPWYITWNLPFAVTWSFSVLIFSFKSSHLSSHLFNRKKKQQQQQQNSLLCLLQSLQLEFFKTYILKYLLVFCEIASFLFYKCHRKFSDNESIILG